MGQLAYSTQGLRPPPSCTWHRGAVVDAGITAHIPPSEPSPHYPSYWGCCLLTAGSWVPLQALSSAKEKHVIPQSDAWTNGLVIWNDKGLTLSLLQSRKFLEDHPASDLPMGLFNFFLCSILPGNTPQWHSWEQIFTLESFLREAEQGTRWEQVSTLASGCTWKEGLIILSHMKMPF